MADNQQTQQSPSFDPDAYLKAHDQDSGFDPDAYLRPHRIQDAQRIYSEIQQGKHPDMDEHEALAITKLASLDPETGKPTTPSQRAGTALKDFSKLAYEPEAPSWYNRVTIPGASLLTGGKMFTTPTAQRAVGDLTEQAVSGAKGLYKEAAKQEDPWQGVENTLGGAIGGTGKFIANTGINALTGAANLTGKSFLNKEGVDPDVENAKAALLQGKINHAIETGEKASGVDPESYAYGLGALAGPFLLPPFGAGETAGAVAKGVSKATELAPKAAGYAIEGIGKAAGTRVGQAAIATGMGGPAAGAGVLLEGGLEKTPVLGGMLRKMRKWATDATAGNVEDFGKTLRSIPDGGTFTGVLAKDVQDTIAKKDSLVSDIATRNKIKSDAEVFQKHQDGTFLYPDDKLPTKEQKSIRDEQNQITAQQGKLAWLKKQDDVNKVLSYARDVGLTATANTAVGAGIGATIAGVNAPPGKAGEAAQEGGAFGALLTTIPVHVQAPGLLKSLRQERGAAKYRDMGASNVLSQDHPLYEAQGAGWRALPEKVRDVTQQINGFLANAGEKVVPLKAEDLVNALRKNEGIEVAEAPDGYYSEKNHIAYINADNPGAGNFLHEPGHAIQNAYKSALGKYNEALDNLFEQHGLKPQLDAAINDYQKQLMAQIPHQEGEKGFILQGRPKLETPTETTTGAKIPSPTMSPETIRAEITASLAADLFAQHPPADLHGGKGGGQILKDWLSKLLPQKTSKTTQYGFPVTPEMRQTLQDALFKAEEDSPTASRTAPDEPTPETTRPSEQNAATESHDSPSAPQKTTQELANEVEQDQQRPQVVPAVEPQEAEAVGLAREAILKSFGIKNAGGRERIENLLNQAVADAKQEGVALDAQDLFKRVAQPDPHKVQQGEFKKPGYTALSQAKIPQNEGQLSKATVKTAPVPQEPTTATPERGVAGVVQEPAEQAGHPDYQAIRSEAESKKREELSGTKRKTKDKEIERAGIEAMAQAHAEHVGNTDLVALRTDRFGDSSIGGKSLDPNDPFHQHLIEKAGLTPEQVDYVNQFSENMGEMLGLENYAHAAKEGEATGVTRKAEQERSTAQQRVEKAGDAQNAPLNIVPTWIKFNQPSNRITVHGFNPDKFLSNGAKLESYPESGFKKAYPKGVNDPQIPQDLSDWKRNNDNGWTGDGRKQIEGTPFTSAKINPDYKPAIIPHDRFQVLNAMMGAEEPKGRTAKSKDAQILGQQNAGFVRPETGEFNQVRAKLGDEAGLLENVNESLRPENISGRVSNEPVTDEHLLRPSGAKPETVKAIADVIGEQGAPRFSSSGFMPSTDTKYTKDAGNAQKEGENAHFMPSTKQTESPEFKRWFGKSKITDEDGNPLALYHGTTHDFAAFDPDKANIENDWGKSIYLTNTPEDVAANYAGVGPDLTNRIERRMENLVDDTRDNSPEAIRSQLGITKSEARIVASTPKWNTPAYRKRQAILRNVAKREMTTHGGATMKVFAKMENPLEIGGENEPYWDVEWPTDKDGEILDDAEPTGKMIDFVNAIRNASSHYSDADPNPALENYAYEGGRPSEVIKALRESQEFSMATDPDTGDIAPSHIIKEALQNMGYDGVIDHEVNKKFGSERSSGKQMEGMHEGTVHYIAFEPTQIKSATGNRGTFDPNDPNMSFMPSTPKQFETVAKQYGLRYNGVQGDKLHLFSDPQTRTTFSVPIDATSEQVQKKLLKARELMGGEDKLSFMPSSRPGAIQMPAVKFPDGKVYSDVMHSLAYTEALDKYPTSKLAEWMERFGDSFVKTGYLDNRGKWLDRDGAEKRGLELGQFTKPGLKEARKYFGDSVASGRGLQALDFARARKFSQGGLVKALVSSPLRRAKVA